MKRLLGDMDPKDISILSGPDGIPQVIDAIEMFNMIFDGPGVPDLSMARWYVHRIPFFINGEQHPILRADMTRLLAERYDTLIKTPIFTDDEARILSEAPAFNLVHSIAKVVVDRVIQHYVSMPDEALAFLNQFNTFRFHAELRIGRVRDLDKILKLIYDATLADPERAGFADLIPIFIITRHTFIGTIAVTIADVLNRTEGQLLKNLKFPSMLTETALPFVGRVAAQDAQGANQFYPKGSAYRCPVNTRVGARVPDTISSFGEPPRACLGRTMSILAWRNVADELNRAMALRSARGERRFDIVTPVELQTIGSRPEGGDLEFS